MSVSCKGCKYFGTQTIFVRVETPSPLNKLPIRETYEDVEEQVNACRKVTPTVSTVYTPTWPIVKEDDWCSYYEEAPESLIVTPVEG